MAEELGFDSWQEKGIFISSISRQAERPTYAPFQWVPVSLSS
jgi:hypothetical protein